ncbi:uncharacterized protein PV07_12843 [Cladophialophora immunda]|uniref:Uncharacterized protein n=1 Tax=Cladophialophora immunda TaxID=569365 RepID=A0A0D2BTH2_9EURO|nr:uncharacterized protein PV07_12843 [Cladophialophora immunda]KIW21725.1 hypothetical protein PV07_12843 [Cladophialophora immunda]
MPNGILAQSPEQKSLPSKYGSPQCTQVAVLFRSDSAWNPSRLKRVASRCTFGGEKLRLKAELFRFNQIDDVAKSMEVPVGVSYHRESQLATCTDLSARPYRQGSRVAGPSID